MKRTLPLLLLAAACALAPACVPAHPPTAPPPAPATTRASTSVPGDSASLAQAVALAEAREWTVRVVALAGDKLVGRVSRPEAGRLRIRLRDIDLAQVSSLDRKEDRGGGLYETRLLAGAAAGAMVGLVAGIVVGYAGDLETGYPVGWMIPGAIVGLLLEAPRRATDTATTWVPLWRRP